MADWDDDVNRHAAELARLTMQAADQGPDPLPEDEVAELGRLIAIERQLLIDSMTMLIADDEVESGPCPGAAEFDAGFAYGLAFARALEDARVAIDRTKRGRVLRLVRAT